MGTDNMNLNLARKWRSKNFDQIIGQALSVRMLKNSLYLNQFFPVYLFSGQRGCGKTSTARVFAAAINCSRLHAFQKKPKSNMIPCLTCSSCQAMLAGNHPDFIEIDAASHTGVDNVRQIIEASSFLPLVGDKKIYLIDEAHMLSKAAFNAFLKILEEPPSSVIFILATTSLQKIIETVRSRCFQLFFKPVANDSLMKHLENICKSENISYDETGLRLIVKESQGSVRDSINILEQVRFSSSCVNKKSVQHILGHIDDERLVKLFEYICTKNTQEILSFLKDLKLENFSAEYVWYKILDLLRAAIWISHDVNPSWNIENFELLKKIVLSCPAIFFNRIMQLFYDNEAVFLKTTSKHSLLEMILLQISQKNNTNDFSNKSGASAAPQMPLLDETCFDDEQEDEEEEIEEIEDVKKNEGQSWNSFLSLLDQLDDPLISSIFKNGTYIGFDIATEELTVKYLRQFSFFRDSFEETKSLWYPLMQQVFSHNIRFMPLFEGEAEIKMTKPKPRVLEKNVNPSLYRVPQNNIHKNKEKLVDVSDTATWKKANTLLKYFSGSVKEVQDI